MLVPVPVVGGVPVAVVGVGSAVVMDAVEHGRMPAAGAVLMGVAAVRDVLTGLARVPAAGVFPVRMPVVREGPAVVMDAVRYGGVSAARPVGVVVAGVFGVGSGHGSALSGKTRRAPSRGARRGLPGTLRTLPP